MEAPPREVEMSRVLELLHQLVPSSRSISSDFYLSADSVIAALRIEKLETPLTRIPNFDEGDWDDESLMGSVFHGRAGFHQGKVFIHTPACSRYGLDDFSCQSEGLEDFIRGYDFEMVFDGDVIFLAPESSTLTVFHHEGAFGHFKLS
jgi:hypothetical protein